MKSCFQKQYKSINQSSFFSKKQMEVIKQFIHSPDFWKWHGFVLSIAWLFGSSIGILLKKRSILAHLIAFAFVDYSSLLFMGTAIYLIIPQLIVFEKWNIYLKIHVILGLLFLVLMVYQHILGAITWHRDQSNRNHRKLGTKLALFGRILAGIGWMIQQNNKIFAVSTFVLALAIYLFIQRNYWPKIKTN